MKKTKSTLKAFMVPLAVDQPAIIYAFPNTIDHQYELKCIHNAKNMNLNVYEALQVIRARFKHGDNVSDKEQDTLNQIRDLLGEYYVEG